MIKVKGYRGTRDLLPADWFLMKYLFNKWREVSEKYGFSEYEAPIIENLKLFTSKSGEEIKEQLFYFKDKSGRKVCLRAELTPQLARYVVEYGKELKKPLKWYSIPRLFRYERPQKGRLREFFQYNADIVGSNIKGTAEIINLSIDLLKSFGLKKKDFIIKINDRAIIEKIITKYKVKNKDKFYSLLDKKYKMREEEFTNELKKLVKNDILINALTLTGSKCLKKLGVKSKRLNELMKLLDDKLIEFDPSIVRGLDYYTGIVFEAYDKKGELRALMGGGEYDNLISDFGGPRIPCVGFGMGDTVLIELLKKKKLLPDFKKEGVFIATIGEVYETAIKKASELRKQGINTYLNNDDANISKQLSLADDLGFEKVMIIGERDLKNNKVTIKNLRTGKEVKENL